MTDAIGYVKLARKAFATDPWWLAARPYSKWEAWVDMIQLAQWKPRKITSTKYGTIRLERGEFILSLRSMAKRWGWGIQSVRTFAQSDEFLTRIQTQRETQAGTVYLIVNYDRYQSPPDESNTPNIAPVNTPLTHLQHTSNTRTSSKASKAVKETPSGVNSLPEWVSPLRVFWNAEVGRLGDASIARDCAPMVASHGPDRVVRAVKLYVAHSKSTNRGMSWKWFVDAHMAWIERAATPLTVIDGEMSPSLELLTRPA